VELGEACTLVLRGASSHILEEAERSIHDALCVLNETVKDSRVRTLNLHAFFHTSISTRTRTEKFFNNAQTLMDSSFETTKEFANHWI
jgi:hypothetical protein